MDIAMTRPTHNPHGPGDLRGPKTIARTNSLGLSGKIHITEPAIRDKQPPPRSRRKQPDHPDGSQRPFHDRSDKSRTPARGNPRPPCGGGAADGSRHPDRLCRTGCRRCRTSACGSTRSIRYCLRAGPRMRGPGKAAHLTASRDLPRWTCGEADSHLRDASPPGRNSDVGFGRDVGLGAVRDTHDSGRAERGYHLVGHSDTATVPVRPHCYRLWL